MAKMNRSVYSKQDTYLTEMGEGGCLIENMKLHTESGTLVSCVIYVFEDVTLCNRKGFRLLEGHFLS